ncbi:MAG: fimbrillin family protein [Prevotella sp.]|nr:fimbrillin family protein [Prevotella sp.]
MKKRQYLTLIAVVLLATACSNETVFTEETPKPQPLVENAITFSVDLEGGTRAVGEKSVIADNDAIGVFACYTGDIKYNLSTVTPDYMYNQKVKYSGSTWTYTPVKYWPNTTDGDGYHRDYVSFFSYYPYTAGDTEGIIGFSNKDAAGDPWLVFQLPADAPNTQVDLLYGVAMLDLQKQGVIGKVDFSLRHALACVGDQISIQLSADLSTALGAKALYVNNVTINYKNLTNKARLILNSNNSPNWQPVISGDYISNRTVTLPAGTYIASGTSPTPLTSTTPVEISSGNGLFYIPMHLGAVRQEAEITVEYTIKDSETTTTGSVTNSYFLREDAQQKESINIVLGKSLIP